MSHSCLPNGLFLLICIAMLEACSVQRAKQLQVRHRADPVFSTWHAGKGPEKEARLHYLGCGGFLLEYAGEGLLIDPYFSNISLAGALFCRLQSDQALIDTFFQRQTGGINDTSGNIGTILISHAHHDHLADVPALLQNNLSPTLTRVYGSNTSVHLLRSFQGLVADSAAQLIDLEAFLGAKPPADKPAISPFFYTNKRRIRFAALPSGHAGHYFFIKGQKLPGTAGSVRKPRKKAPNRVLNFKEGENFNFLIDLLDENGQPVFRIFSNAGAACDAGQGYPPNDVLNEKNVDLLLICGANYNIAKDYPDGLLDYLRPAGLFVGHWENFFQPIRKLQKKPATVPNTNIPKLMRLLVKYAEKRGVPRAIFLEQPLGKPLRLFF
ncbi:MAG: hypothetical protein SFV22_11235 [Saprospiraceae bacterium]|nr:hypothetical protein [Saprospiraceae bacterium]